MVITSLQNERIKAVRALEMRKERKATGLFVAEGASVMMMGEEHDIAPELVVRLTNNPDEPKRTQAFCTWAMERGADVLEVTARVLGKLAHKDNPQSLLGVYRQRWAKLPPLSACKDTDLWLALEGVRDPGNLGTIIRTADAVGAAGIILIGTCCDAYTRESVRATMGSIFSVPLVRVSQQEFIAWCKSWPGDVVATHLDGSEDFRNVTYRGPVLLMMGSEGPGLTEALVAEASKVVRIPMNGTLDSLNLAVATALTLYEIRRPHL
ncbi:MAG: RNA methyltransferase [Alphaproteobacteria bacterium]|nr:RNA methyltransferase [Alphaproteobacteria bacterium]